MWTAWRMQTKWKPESITGPFIMESLSSVFHALKVCEVPLHLSFPQISFLVACGVQQVSSFPPDVISLYPVQQSPVTRVGWSRRKRGSYRLVYKCLHLSALFSSAQEADLNIFPALGFKHDVIPSTSKLKMRKFFCSAFYTFTKFHTFQLFNTTSLAKDHWRGFSTRNAHMVHIVNLIRLKMV